jgi:tRNA-splicing ligase RtcB (3'-phosphate/5'-hydroxy nucleic acid ligase)
MNTSQLSKLGVPEAVTGLAIQAIQKAAAETDLKGAALKDRIRQVIADPASFADDSVFGLLAKSLVETPADEVLPDPIDYSIWGTDIDAGCRVQMEQACRLPMAAGAALMPDAHVGYGLPIGGVLALRNAVVPYAVGVDIACRMKLSALDMPVETLESRFEHYRQAIERGTRFGIGAAHETPQDHPVMDTDWTVTRVTRENKDKARKQLGTSGSGNHFVEFGTLTLNQPAPDLGLEAGTYVALLSHSGSRGTGSSVCDTYSRIAQARLPKAFQALGRLGWLSLDSEAGQEYWSAMNLMGEYAAANHEVIHRLVSKNVGARIISGVENHHNFAWKEIHNGEELIVHRKGATPAGQGVLGVIPGSMADPGFVVRGKGNVQSLLSASHGAGRRMSRTAARDKYNFRSVKNDLEQKGIRVLSAGADEVPYAYKNILDVMAAQSDLVEIVGRFDPKIVKMADGGPAED